MIPGWEKSIEEAQRLPFIRIDDKVYEKIRHRDSRPCGDCAVLAGQIHVPNCDMERCPICKGQFLTCGCLEEGNFEDLSHNPEET
jgi:hypothetical protein